MMVRIEAERGEWELQETLNLASVEWENHQHEGELEHDGLVIVREERFMTSL